MKNTKPHHLAKKMLVEGASENQALQFLEKEGLSTTEAIAMLERVKNSIQNTRPSPPEKQLNSSHAIGFIIFGIGLIGGGLLIAENGNAPFGSMIAGLAFIINGIRVLFSPSENT